MTVVLRNLSDSTDLRAVLNKKIPEEQERVKSFRKTYGATKVGEVTVDMVSANGNNFKLWYKTLSISGTRNRVCYYADYSVRFYSLFFP